MRPAAYATRPWWVFVDEREEELLVLRLTVEQLLATGDWPTLADLHRRINRELKKQIHDVGAVARRLDRHPFLSGYHDLNDRFAPRLEVLARISESDVLLDAVLVVIKHAHDKYMSSPNAEEVRVTESEIEDELGLEASLVQIVRKLLERIPWVLGDRGSDEKGWYFSVADLITRWSGVETRKDLVDSLEAIEDYNNRQYAEMTRAKAEMVRETQSSPQILVEAGSGATHWYDTPLATGIKWAVGIIVGLLTIFVLVRQL